MAQRVLIIGLDGATWTILQPYLEAGLMPTLAGLWARGFRSRLRSTIPPITPVAWPTMVTGVNPGKHGVFGFGTYRGTNGGYVGRPGHRGDVARPSIWRILSERGLVSRVAHVPMSYPPEEINGSMVSCMFTPGHDVAYTWPPALKDELRQAGIPVKFVSDFVQKSRSVGDDFLHRTLEGDAAPFLDDVDDLTRCQHAVAKHMIAQDWNALMIVYPATDRIQHYLWNDLLPAPSNGQSTPRQARIARSFRLVDDCLGELVELAGPGTTVMLVSDHGFGRTRGQFNLGRWLAEHGYAAYRTESAASGLRRAVKRLGLGPVVRKVLGSQRSDQLSAQTFPIAWDRTRVFLDNNSSRVALWINLRGRFREGIVEPGAEYERLRDGLVEALPRITVPGLDIPVVGRLWRREELFSGPFLDQAPDLIFESSPLGTVQCVTGRASAPLFVPNTFRPGDHLPDGICLIAGEGVAADGRMHDTSLTDVAPTVLALLGQPVPDDMDGKPMSAAFARPLDYTTTQHAAASTEEQFVMSEAQQAEIESRLRNLGYVE